MLADEKIPQYRCLKVTLGDAPNYFRHYADHCLHAHRAEGGWEETAVAPEVPTVVCGYYPYQTVPLSEYPL
jgi:hypothetical protein